MTSTTKESSSRIARRAVKKGARPPVSNQAGIEKSATGKTALLKAKKIISVSTINLRTLICKSKLYETIASAENFGIDILCIQEHRLYHQEIDIKFCKLERNWTLITNSAWKNECNASIGGVGILLSPRATNALTNVERVNERILACTFQGNPMATIISCYFPTNNSNEDEIQEYYNQISSYTRQIPKHNITLICGDFNAQLGQSTLFPYTYHSQTNRNGKYLTDFIQEMNMHCMNTHFRKKKNKLWTIKYANGTKGQIDYILINKKWKNSGINCQAYNTFKTTCSDHRIISAKIRLSLRANKPSKNSQRYNWDTLQTRDDIRDQYTIEVRNRFQILQNENEEESANTIYQNIMKAHKEAAEKCIPIVKKTKRKIPWETASITEKRQSVNKLTRENPKYMEAIQELKDIYDQEQTEYIKSKIDIIKNASINKQSRIAWQTVNEISGRKTTNQSKLRAKNDEERIIKWKDHFSNLLGQPPNIIDKPIIKVIDEELPIKIGNFTMSELQKALQSLPNRKACGLDDIPGEVWKTDAMREELLNICNRVYRQQNIDVWTQSCILPFPKKGDLGIAANYRGISLIPISAKIYNKMLLNRIRPEIEKVLRHNQNGFRPNRGTESQVLTLRRLIEEIKDKNISAVLLFIDFRKAFDSIHRRKMENILTAYGIPEETIKAIMMLYKNTKAKVRSPDGDTDFFEILAGVLQGDTLSPYLFIICLDYALRTALGSNQELGLTLSKAKSRRHPAVKITDADYADDLAALSDTIEDAGKLLQLIETAANAIGLHINEKKTEYIAFNQKETNEALKKKNIKQVDDFVYLGSHITSTETDVKARIGKAWSALNKLDKIWKSKLERPIKIEFFRATVESVLLYGCSTWTLTKCLEARLNGNYTRMLRAVQDIHWSQRITNTELYYNLPRISDTIRERRTRFAGHCWRSKRELIHQTLLWTPTHGNRRRGRPPLNYVDQLEKDTGIKREDLPRAMEDRTAWRELVINTRASSTR